MCPLSAPSPVCRSWHYCNHRSRADHFSPSPTPHKTSHCLACQRPAHLTNTWLDQLHKPPVSAARTSNTCASRFCRATARARAHTPVPVTHARHRFEGRLAPTRSALDRCGGLHTIWHTGTPANTTSTANPCFPQPTALCYSPPQCTGGSPVTPLALRRPQASHLPCLNVPRYIWPLQGTWSIWHACRPSRHVGATTNGLFSAMLHGSYTFEKADRYSDSLTLPWPQVAWTGGSA
jgi:hypothetical protein